MDSGARQGHAAAAGRPRGASSVEVYGFVGSIASGVAFAVYCLWALLPEPLLGRLGVTYYPDKQWALVLPTYLIVGALCAYWAYESANMTSVAPPTCPTTIHDEHSKWITQLRLASAGAATDSSIPPLVHMPAPLVSRVLYVGEPFRQAEACVFAGRSARPRAV